MHQRIARGAGAMLQEALLPMRTRAARALGQASAPSPQKPERSVWRPDRIPHRARALGLAARPFPHRARALGLAARPIPQHGQKKKRPREEYGFVVDFFDRRSHPDMNIISCALCGKVRVLPGRRDARCATAAERGGPTDNRDTPRGTIDARARLASAIARHRHRQSATTVRPPPRRRYPRHRPALATAAQAATVATSLAAAEAACSMATRWRSATGSCPTFVLKATSASTKGMVDGHARHERERIRAPEATWWRRDARSQWPADGDAGRRR